MKFKDLLCEKVVKGYGWFYEPKDLKPLLKKYSIKMTISGKIKDQHGKGAYELDFEGEFKNMKKFFKDAFNHTHGVQTDPNTKIQE